MFTAVVRITGAGRLDDFRERLRWLMVRDEDAEDYTEHHAPGTLEYRFAPRRGIPFPAFTAASVDFPELRVEAEWERDGERGRAVIENGQLVEQTKGRVDEANSTRTAHLEHWNGNSIPIGDRIGHGWLRRPDQPATNNQARQSV